MEREVSKKELEKLLDAIKSSDVVESRVQLINKLGHLELSEKCDVASLIDCLKILWEDFTCLDISQCVLNKTILHVVAKYVEFHFPQCLASFLELGTKASIWCAQHLKMTVMSAEESQEEEHSDLFFQLLLEYFSFSKACFVALTKHPVSSDKATITAVEKFLSEQLNLAREAISESKRINSSGPEVIKCAQSVIDSTIQLCKEYSKNVDWEISDTISVMDKSSSQFQEATIRNNVINITKCAVEKLCEIGTLAASGGGSLVAILNVSWKGVVDLLQLGNNILAEKLNVGSIVMSLVSLINQSLKCAMEAWSLVKEPISVNEARKTFIPVKFYLINAVKICSLYPCQAYPKEIASSVLMILGLIISMCQVKHLQVASELSMELLEKTCLDLITSLYKSSLVKDELKFEILDWLFSEDCDASLIQGEMLEIFSVIHENMPGEKMLLLGRVSLFLSHLRYSVDLEDDVKHLIARKLGWFLDTLINEEVYSSVLTLQIPQTYGFGKNMELNCEPLFQAILHALKTFMVVVSSSSAWEKVESFLLQNIFHPHFLSFEIIMELWCFIVQNAEIDFVQDIIYKLCELMKSVACRESLLIPNSAIRKLARSICMLLKCSTQSVVDWVYNSIIQDNGSQSSSILYVALVLEGFPLNLLSENLRSSVKQKTITDYYGFIESFKDKLSDASSGGAFGFPVFALSSSLHQVSLSDVDMKTLKFLVAISQKYKTTIDKQIKSHYSKLLRETLSIVSNLKHLYSSDEMEQVIFEIRSLFMSAPITLDSQLCQCKPELAVFIAGLGHMAISERDDCSKSKTMWELYHMLLKEQHWALAHLSINAFGYFAAHTDCNQLWKFVPQDAALSYDPETGNDTDEARFMSELKVLLEKEMALLAITPSSEQVSLLVKEGTVLKEAIRKNLDVYESVKRKRINLDEEKEVVKRRKLPDEVKTGMELLQSGLKMVGNGLSQLDTFCVDSPELKDKFLAQFSLLDDTIGQLVGLMSADQG
ncbi:hypothetical protein ACFE04_015381 [Oxalis oulophora]